MYTNTFLVHYQMLWGGKVVETDILEVEAVTSSQAESKCKVSVLTRNKKADFKVIETIML